MALMRYPWTMRGLMPNQQAPWPIIILLVKPRQRTVGQHVGRISFDRHIAIRRMEQWVDVCALIVEHLPVIESSRIVNTAMPHMPFAEERRCIPESCNNEANVGCLASIGVSSVVTPLMWLYAPVRIVARDGAHSELVTKARLKRTPPEAIASIFGV